MVARSYAQSSPRHPYLFQTVDKALSITFELLAMSGAIRTPGYDIPSSRSTGTDKKTVQDRFIEAAWVKGVTETALDDVQLAHVTCRYTGLSEEREWALRTLTTHLGSVHRNDQMLCAVIEREYQFGETYARSLPDIAREFGASQSTVERASRKVRSAIYAIAANTTEALRSAFDAKGWIPRARC